MARKIKIESEFDGKQAEAGMQKLANQVGKASKDSALSFKNLGVAADSALKGLTGFGLGGLTAVGAIVGIGNALKKQISQWQEYALRSSDAAKTVGMNVEEFTRLVQVADDVRLSQDTLTLALQNATKNGFEPSIDNLAKLADEIQGMSVTERAAKLSDMFGRSWKEVYKILEGGGDALKKNTQAVADGLVVTQQAAIEAQKLYKAQDNLNDAWQSLVNTGTRLLIPAIAQQVNILAENWDMLAKGIPLFEVLRYNQIEYAAMELANSAANRSSAERYTGLALSMGYVIDESGNLVKSTGEVNGAIDGNISRVSGLKDAWDNYQAAVKAAEDANKSFSDKLGGDLASALEAANIGGEKLYNALGVVDEKLGTSTLPTKKLKDEQQKLVDEYKRTGDLDAFGAGLQRLNDKYRPLQEEIIKTRVAVQDLENALNIATSKEYTFYVNVIQNGSLMGGDYVPPAGTSTTGSGLSPGDTSYVPPEVYIPHRAGGGDVKAGHPYWVGEEGPEPFIPKEDGTILPNGAGGITIQQLILPNVRDAAQFARELRGMSFGKQYQGR